MFDQKINNSSQDNSATEGDSAFVPDEFLRLAERDDSITSRGAMLFGTSPRNFVNWRWQMRHQITDLASAVKSLDLDASEQSGFQSLDQIFNAGLTPYYLALANPDARSACPIRLQAIPRIEELGDYVGVKDPLLEKEHSPVREVVHLYPDRVAFCVAQLCPVYCRYCYRKRRDEEVGLHFNRAIVDRGVEYIRPIRRSVTCSSPAVIHLSRVTRLLFSCCRGSEVFPMWRSFVSGREPLSPCHTG